jgi:hypothetical protein
VKRSAFILCLVAAAFIPALVHCRETTFGVKFGLEHFSYIGEDYQNFLESNGLRNALKLGLVAGVFATIHFTDVFGFQPEILVVWAGDAYKGPASSWDAVLWGPYYGQVKYSDRVTYLVIPALIKIRFRPIALFVGPTLMVKLGNGTLSLDAEDEVLQWDFWSTGLDSREYTSGVFSSFLLAATAGIGVELSFGRYIFLLEARGHYVLTNVLGSNQGATFNAYGIGLMAGYGVGPRERKAIRTRLR